VDGVDAAGKTVITGQLRRGQVIGYFGKRASWLSRRASLATLTSSGPQARCRAVWSSREPMGDCRVRVTYSTAPFLSFGCHLAAMGRRTTRVAWGASLPLRSSPLRKLAAKMLVEQPMTPVSAISRRRFVQTTAASSLALTGVGSWSPYSGAIDKTEHRLHLGG
jgi:hypothetical protein